MDNDNMFAERLREARAKAKMTQAVLGSKANVTAATISAYENPDGKKRKNPSVDSAKKIAEALGVSIDWLCGNELNVVNHHENPIKAVSALFTVVKEFNPEIKLKEGIASLTFNLEFETVSAMEINKFFEEYSAIRKIESSGLATDKMIETLEMDLIKNYKHLPGLPPYNFGKQE